MRTKTRTVMVVEDDEDIRKMITDFLEMEGFSVQEASNGREAVDLIFRQRPDIALVDVTLPDISGFEICRTIKNDDALKETEVIFITGRTALSDRLSGFLAGAKRYLCKPFEMDDLLEHINFLSGARCEKREYISPLREDVA